MSSENVLALLQIETPGEPEQTVPITKSPFNVGRSASNDLQLPDDLISRHHARLLFEDDRIHLIDLQSSNGTFVGEARLVPNEPYPIAFRETFRIGPYILRLEARAKPPPEEEPEEPAREAVIGTVDVAALQADSEPAPHVTIGAVELPPPEPPPLPPTDGLLSYDEAFGVPKDSSRYLKYLPPIYREHPFLGRFLLAFEGVLAPIEQTVDSFDLYLDPHTAPAFFLDQLARWLDVTLDEKWPMEKRRAVVAEAADLYRRRGTRWSLGRLLEIYAGVTPQIVEPDDQPHHFNVVLHIPSGQRVDRATVKRIIEANKPAHTTYSLEMKFGG